MGGEEMRWEKDKKILFRKMIQLYIPSQSGREHALSYMAALIKAADEEIAFFRNGIDNQIEMKNKAIAQRNELQEENTRLREALKRSVLALDDWLNIYAEELCERDRVAQAKSRIQNYGTVGYIAEVQKQNREALKENSYE